MYLRSTRTEILISDVVMTWMLMPSCASTLNILAATPAWDRMPMPTTEILQTPVSARISWKLMWPDALASFIAFCARATWFVGQENVMSVRPSSEMF